MKSIIGIALALLAFALLIHIGIGSTLNYTPWDILREIFRGDQGDNEINRVVWSLRLPRASECVFVGLILGVSGAIFQSLFRNPLAEPYIVGASSGAAVGGAIAQAVAGSFLTGILLEVSKPLAGFVTGMLALGLVMALATRRGVVETPTMLLSGVVISTMLSAVLSLIVLASGNDQGVVLRWLLGSVSEANLLKVGVLATTFVVGYPMLYRLSRHLNALSLGEETSKSVGVDPVKTRNITLCIVTAMVATSVGTVGIVGFVGLVAPHIARKIVGVDLRRMMPLATIIGGLLLLVSDVIAQRCGEIPVGIVTAILGAPSLLVLLRRS